MVTTRTFLIGIYQEHFEELGFMYERRLQWLDDPDLTFDDIGELEERMEAHLDGLVLGESLANEVCMEGLSGEDFGTLYSATSVFCRSDRWDLVERTLVFLDAYIQGIDSSEFEDVQRARKAMADALAFHAPASWEQSLIEALKNASPAVVPVLARCVGYRRFKSAGKILCEAASRQGVDAEEVLWALGRVHHPDAVEVLRYHALWGGPRTATAATISGLRTGDRYMLDVLKDRAHGENWPAIPLAIGGGAEELPVLLALAAPHRITSEALIALGVLGDMRAVSRLLDGLSSEKTAEASATGLYLLTGAAVVEVRETEDADTVGEVDTEASSDVSCRLSLRREAWVETLGSEYEPSKAVQNSSNLRHRPVFIEARAKCLYTFFAPLHTRFCLAQRLANEDPSIGDLECDTLQRYATWVQCRSNLNQI